MEAILVDRRTKDANDPRAHLHFIAAFACKRPQGSFAHQGSFAQGAFAPRPVDATD